MVDPPPARGALRAVCVHEYAHLLVARRLGACGFVAVRASPASTAFARRWHGSFQLFGELSDEEWRIVALAGAIAEHVDEALPCDAPSLIQALRRPGALSDSDARLACGYAADDVEACLHLVRLCWREIEAEAAERVAAIEAGDAAWIKRDINCGNRDSI